MYQEVPEFARQVEAPAPWDLVGDAYIFMLHFPAPFLREQTFLPDALKDRHTGRFGYVFWIRYRESPVGPYDELIFLPGQLRFPDGKKYWSISRIYVSSWESVYNGRRNWGIPKEWAEFSVEPDSTGKQEHVTLSLDGRPFVQMHVRKMGWGLPVSTGLLPRSLYTLGQEWEGQQFIFTPEVKSSIQPAHLLSCEVDPTYFPDFSVGKSLTAVYMHNVRMRFPIAQISEVTS